MIYGLDYFTAPGLKEPFKAAIDMIAAQNLQRLALPKYMQQGKATFIVESPEMARAREILDYLDLSGTKNKDKRLIRYSIALRMMDKKDSAELCRQIREKILDEFPGLSKEALEFMGEYPETFK